MNENGQLLSDSPSIPITFNALLEHAGYDLRAMRFLRHQQSDALKGRSVYEIWRDDRNAFDRYQALQGAFVHRSLARSTHWASFIGTPQGETMFAGLYKAKYIERSNVDLISQTTGEIDPAGSLYIYDLKPEAYLRDYVGRIFIEWDAPRAWYQVGSRKSKAITEIRREFKEPAFPGYLELCETLSRIATFPSGWIAALSAARGVYSLTCPRTKELYIGSATGDDGFWGRWSDYVRDGHGGNIQLKSRDRSDYQVSILEVAGSSQTSQDIQNLESRWKNKLQTRRMGLNSN